MQYTYYGTCDDPNKSIEPQELNCVIKKEESINGKITRLILEHKFSEAVEMITHIKDLKFNGDSLNCCYNMEDRFTHMNCGYEITFLMQCICKHNNYMDVIMLLDS